MKLISFGNVWKLIHVYQFLLFPQLSKKLLLQLLNLKLDTLLLRFYDSVWTNKSMNWMYKTNIVCYICPSGTY